MSRLPFRLQVLGGFLALQAAVLVSSLVLVQRIQAREAEEHTRRSLLLARSVLETLFASRGRRLAEGLRYLGGDFAFKKALATREPATIESAALNFRGRSGADLVWAGDERGRVFADTRRALRPGASLAGASAVRAALKTGEGAATVLLGGKPYQLAAVSIDAPERMGVLAAGFAVDDSLAAELKRITGCDVTFAVEGGAVVASTLDAGARGALAAAGLAPGRTHVVGPAGARRLVLPFRPAPELTVYAERSWDAALEPAAELRKLLVLVGLAGFGLTVLLGFFLADRVTDSIQRLVDQLRVKNEELSVLNEMQRRFFITVAHDVRNPLMVLLGYAQLLQERGGPQREAGAILRCAQILEFLISNLIDFAAMETGKLRMEFKEVDPLKVVRDVQARMEFVAGTRKISFTVAAPESLPRMTADAERLAQVLQNLCTNALHYTREGGTVTLAAAAEGDGVRFSVKDTGIGMSPQDLQRIFERFFQAGNAVQLRRGGFGLGLKIVREIVQAHGGAIEVRSELDKGSEFTVRLPLAARAPA